MMNRLTHFIMSFIILAGCRHGNQNNNNENREVFNAKGNQVYTVYANRCDRTMSVVYGNKLAIQGVANGHLNAEAGTQLTVVTYQQDNNKFWYGSYINGGIIAVEQLTLNSILAQKPGWDYKLLRGRRAMGPNGIAVPVSERIREILNKQPVVFL